MATRRKITQKEAAMAAIDSRIYSLIIGVLETDDLSSTETLGYLRAAYVQGYTDCLREEENVRGKWIKDLGYGIKGVEV